MTSIRLYNTKSRRKEDFAPLNDQNVRMYVCGPTVYDRAHLGNGRPVIVFDVLYRLLRHVYGADHVTYVRNFTDVDDKINAEALRRQKAVVPGTLEELINGRAEETIAWYHADMDALGALRPNHEPRATAFIDQMIAMIEGLISSGHAYEKEGHVLFRVRSYSDYGKLSGRSVDDMIAGARVEIAPFKEDPMDFVLWKPSSGEEPGWPSPWGKGRPGWHIECSAMAHELLGESFDIHGGGLDLQFPHHENEIAQSACAHPHGEFARIWMHNEMLQVEGKKMSKSLGNFFTVRDLLEQGISGEVIRFVMLMTHYRSPMDWTDSKRRQAEGHLSKWNKMKRERLSDPSRAFSGKGVDSGVLAAIADDLNSPLALKLVFEMADKLYGSRDPALDSDQAESLFETLAFLGFTKLDPDFLARRHGVLTAIHQTSNGPDLKEQILDLQQRLASLRKVAVATKDFSAVDTFKSALIAAGVEVRMSKAGVELVPGPDFDPAKLEALL
jgi:cysteinyl-tRNA synthetase